MCKVRSCKGTIGNLDAPIESFGNKLYNFLNFFDTSNKALGITARKWNQAETACDNKEHQVTRNRTRNQKPPVTRLSKTTHKEPPIIPLGYYHRGENRKAERDTRSRRIVE
jgi:hypothetical protein